MVHGALLGVAITSTVVAIAAFEVSVFRPWREENWPEGIGEEIRREWHSVKEDVRQVLGGRDAWSARNEARRRQRRSSASSRGSSTAHEEDQLRREVDEFELHEREVLRMREGMLSEFETTQHQQEQIPSSSALQVHRGTDARQRHQTKISEHHARQAANLTASRARRELHNLRQRQKQSKPVDMAPDTSSQQSSVLFDGPTYDEPESPHHALGDDASVTNSDDSPLLSNDATPPALPPKPQAYAFSPPTGSSYATAHATSSSSYATAVSSATLMPPRRLSSSSSASSTHSHASDTSNLLMDRSRHAAVIQHVFSSFDELRHERLASSSGTLRSSHSVKSERKQASTTPRSSDAASPAPSSRPSPLLRSASLSTHNTVLELGSSSSSTHEHDQNEEHDMHIVSPPASCSGWTDARSVTSGTVDEARRRSRAASSSSSTSAFSYAIPPSASSLGVRSSDAASSRAHDADADGFDDDEVASLSSASHNPFAGQASSTLFLSAETHGQWRMPGAASLGGGGASPLGPEHEETRNSDDEWDRVSDVASGFPSPRTAIRSLRNDA